MIERYHFFIDDGSSAVDAIAADLSSVVDARREALRLAAERLYAEDGTLVIPPGWRIDVTDDAGKLLFQIQFSANDPERRPAC